MALSVGIVGLPNVGKSTLFNALTSAHHAEAANYPFCTIEPNQAVVCVPDKRLDALAEALSPPRTVPATVRFVDIAGLVRGASEGEGLGNQFLGHIRDTDVILHVVRCFEDDNVVHVEGGTDAVRDAETVETEIILSDIQVVEGRIHKLSRQARADPALRGQLHVAEALLEHLNGGSAARSFPKRGDVAFADAFRDTPLLSTKLTVYCANIGDDETASGIRALREYAAPRGALLVTVAARTEEELLDVSPEERREYLEVCGLPEGGLGAVVRVCYEALGLLTFFTANEKELHAWELRSGLLAPQAAGKVHSDFERGFIRAEVVPWQEYAAHRGEAGCRVAGVARTEGKDYVVQDGDVMLFRFSSAG